MGRGAEGGDELELATAWMARWIMRYIMSLLPSLTNLHVGSCEVSQKFGAQPFTPVYRSLVALIYP